MRRRFETRLLVLLYFAVLSTRFSILPTAGQRRASGGVNDGNNCSDARLGSCSG
jgi:hypothetical protein